MGSPEEHQRNPASRVVGYAGQVDPVGEGQDHPRTNATSRVDSLSGIGISVRLRLGVVIVLLLWPFLRAPQWHHFLLYKRSK